MVDSGGWRVEGGGWKLLRHESAEGQGVKADGGAIFVVDNLLFQASLVRSYQKILFQRKLRMFGYQSVTYHLFG